MQTTESTVRKLDNEFTSIAGFIDANKFKEGMATNAVGNALKNLEGFTRTQCDRQNDEQALERLKTSIQKIQKVAKRDDLKANLVDLASKVDHLLKYGIIKEKFTAKSTASCFEIAQQPFKALFRFLTESISDEINTMVYDGWASKVKNENLKESIQNELGTKYRQWAAAAHSQATTVQQHQKIDERHAQEAAVMGELVDANPKMQKIKAIREKAEATRMQMMAIGGKRIELESADGVKLDATYLSAEELLKKFQVSNGQFFTIPLNSTESIHGIAFKASQEFDLRELLCQLSLVSSKDKAGAGYCLVMNPQNRKEFFLVQEQQIVQNSSYFKDKNGVYEFSNPDLEVKYGNLRKSFQNNHGAAILTSGNAGVYEMHKGEAMALLMQGVDVMLLNVRGYGESEGKPYAEGSYLDIEAAYQFVKKERRGLPDPKIVAWSMCLSGGIGAHLAERHPEMNLFLNQTYADMASMLKEQVSKKVARFLSLQNGNTQFLRAFVHHYLTEIIFYALSFIAPNYQVKGRLKNITGKVCTIQALSDSFMTQKETKEMAAVMAAHRIQHYPIKIPGKHGSNWTQVMVPEIQMQTTKGVIQVGIQNYLKVFMNSTNYYLPKGMLDTPRGVKINSYNFRRKFKETPTPYEICVTSTNDPTETMHHAKEVEASDSKDFIDKLSRSNFFVQHSFQWNWLGHNKINEFLQKADLSRAFF